MKIEKSQKIATNITGAVQFGVSQDVQKLFSMLSNYLYSNKEFCVLHEISANAWDAHVMADKANMPFHVQLPTRLDLNLRIRDFGPGLSEQNVYALLATFGASTKQGDNTTIGGWGIGSKSPAAVTNTWKIHSHHDGVMNDFLVFIDEKGIPSITKIRSESTDQTGVEVVIPVQESSIHTWQSTVQNVYRHYPVKPRITNWSGTINSPKYALDNTTWAYNQAASAVVIVTSHREYALDSTATNKIFQSMERVDSDAGTLIKYLKMPLVLRFAIGEVELSISREQLQITQITIDSIHERLREIHEFMKEKFEETVKDSVDELEYRVNVFKFMHMVFGQGKYYSEHINSIVASFVGGKYNIKAIPSDLRHLVLDLGKMSDMESKNVKAYNGTSVKTVKTHFNCWKSHVISTQSDTSKTYTVKLANNQSMNYYNQNLVLQVENLDRVTICEADVKDSAARIRHNHSSFGTKYVLLLETPAIKTLPKFLQLKVRKCSMMPKAPRQPRVPAAAKKLIDSTLYRVYANSFERYELDPADNLCYVVTSRYTSKDGIETSDEQRLVNWLQYNSSGVHGRTRILGFKRDKKTNKILGDTKKIPTILKYLNDSFDQLLKSSFIEKFKNEETKTFMTRNFEPWQNFIALKSKKKSAWNDFFDKYQVEFATAMPNSMDRNQWATLESLAHLLGREKEIPKFSVPADLEKDLTLFLEKYKMIKWIRIGYGIKTDQLLKDVADYIESV